MTRDELELEAKYLDVEERFIAAKLAGRDSDEYRAAKAELNEMRTFWRGIREMFAPADGVARPKPITAKIKAQKG